MSSNRLLVIFALIVLIASSINLLIDQDSENSPGLVIGRNDPDMYMRSADITQFNKKGEKQHNILAERLTHFPLTNITTLKSPKMILYPTLKNETPWHISSDHGRQLPSAPVRDEVIELWDSVVATQTNPEGKFISISTESLTVYPAEDYAETTEKVYIEENSGRTTAAGMKAYFDEGRFIFFSNRSERVQTIFLPTFQKRG
ncbi:MAG: LPS export ABC transporter periplasmic protein LptC [Pseudomonadales bacterium]|nr:LPS export ABC transporter periplasmic protein LptC [Pseudomonadales bacterium]